jgi:signal transduction histidine kinase
MQAWPMGQTIRRASRTIWFDIALGVTLGGYGALAALFGGEWPPPRPLSATLVGVAGVALVMRRRAPLPAYAAAILPMAAISMTIGDYQAGSALFITVVAAYSVAAYAARIWPTLAISMLYIASEAFHRTTGEALGAMVFVAAALFVPMGLGLTVRSLHRRTAELQAWAVHLQQQQNALSAAAAAAAASAERSRIARELHDIISHGLGLMVMQAGVADSLLDRDRDRTRAALQLIRDTGQEALAEMGRLIGLVRTPPPGPDPQPTLTDLPRLIDIHRAAGLDVQLLTQGPVRPVPPAIELSAYRVVQESLTNAAKHSTAPTVQVVLRYDDTDLAVHVTNTGETTGPGPGGRLGLAGLQERVHIFDGHFNAGPRPAGGWAVDATFPTQR